MVAHQRHRWAAMPCPGQYQLLQCHLQQCNQPLLWLQLFFCPPEVVPRAAVPVTSALLLPLSHGYKGHKLGGQKTRSPEAMGQDRGSRQRRQALVKDLGKCKAEKTGSQGSWNRPGALRLEKVKLSAFYQAHKVLQWLLPSPGTLTGAS